MLNLGLEEALGIETGTALAMSVPVAGLAQLALVWWAASRAGFSPGEKFWQTMSKHFRGCQNADGGWGGGVQPGQASSLLPSHGADGGL